MIQTFPLCYKRQNEQMSKEEEIQQKFIIYGFVTCASSLRLSFGYLVLVEHALSVPYISPRMYQ